MKKNILTSIFLSIIVIACNNSADVIAPENSSGLTFGIRHDKKLSEYELIASNSAPFNKGTYPDFSSVVFFSVDINKKTSGICTGVLIAPSWVLTAAHCVFDYDTDKSPIVADKITVFTGNDPEKPLESVKVSQFFITPSWLSKGDFLEYGNDLCLIKLAKAITSIPVAKVNFDSKSDLVNNEVWFSGFGDYSGQFGQNSQLYSKKHAMQNVLDRAVIAKNHMIQNQIYTGGILAFDFDDPTGLVNTLGDSYVGPDEQLLGPGTSQAKSLEWEGSTVEGDSGGPLFLKINNQWVVIGILNGGIDQPIIGFKDGNYGDISIFTRCSMHSSWIQKTMSQN